MTQNSQSKIYLSSPDVTEDEEAALVRAIRSGWIAPLGPEINAFEEELSARAERSHAVALSSGTAALHLALLTLGVGPGDVVLVSSFTFAATANAVVYTGAEPVFVDADESGNMNPELLDKALSELTAKGERVKAIVPVDMLGKVADYASIGEVASRYNVPVLSDAAESLGAYRDGKPAGHFGIAAGFSFNGNKIMTTSGGGALVTDDADFAEHVRYLATQARQPVVHYEHTDIGYNYRLSNLLAALGRAQLSRLDDMMERRRQHRRHYAELFSGVAGVSIFGEPSGAGVSDKDVEGTHDNWWLSSILVAPEAAGFTAEDLRLALLEENIESRPLWKPMHLQPVFAEARSFLDGTSDRLFATGLSLPSGSVLGDEEIGRISDAIENFLKERA